MKSKIYHLFENGFFHIVVTNVMNKGITMLTNVLIARLLGRYGYGVFGTAYNIYSIFIIFSGLGMHTAILLYCSEKRSEEEKHRLYRYGLAAGFAASLLLSAGMFVYALCFPLAIPAIREYIILLCLLPLFDYILQYFLVVLRTQRKNKTYALMQNISCVTYFIFGCLGAEYFGISGTITGRYISYFLVICVCYRYVSGSVARVSRKDKLRTDLKKELWGYSIKNGIGGACNQILYFIDVALIAAILKDAELVATYKVATLIPEGLSFIPTCIMIFLVPVIAEHNNDKSWLRNNLKKLFLASGIMNSTITLFLLAFSPQIICLLWGKSYLSSVPCFRLLSVNYFVMATFRMSCTNILAVLRKVNFNLVLGTVSSILDLVLDVLLINRYGMIGAAVATFTTVVFISIISFPYVVYLMQDR